MTAFCRAVHSELRKLLYSRSTWIIVLLILVLQAALATVAAQHLLTIGLDATPETCPNLIEALPPLEYMGFDVVLFSTIPMIVLGALYGAGEFRNHSLRTTMLSTGRGVLVPLSKIFAVSLVSSALSFASIFVTISATHLTFGVQGLPFLLFNPMVWRFILQGSIALTLLTVLASVMGFLFRTAVAPMLFLIVQVFNIGDLLASLFAIGKYLPVHLVNRLIAISERSLTQVPAQNILLLLLWILLLSVPAFLRFKTSDLRGEY